MSTLKYLAERLCVTALAPGRRAYDLQRNKDNPEQPSYNLPACDRPSPVSLPSFRTCPNKQAVRVTWHPNVVNIRFAHMLGYCSGGEEYICFEDFVTGRDLEELVGGGGGELYHGSSAEVHANG